MSKLKDFISLAQQIIRMPEVPRNTAFVTDEYTEQWAGYKAKLEKSNTVEEWLNDADGIPQYCNLDGEFTKAAFDSSDFYRKTFLAAFDKNFPNAKSVAEFGCGVGRNLIYLHLKHPELKLYGFELCKPGVEIGNAAARKFNLPIEYVQLDYLNWLPADIRMPDIDVGFTIFSLEQIPDENLKALKNIHAKVNLGTFHFEPVVENYPYTVRGYLSRVYHRKIGYLRNFESNALKVVGKANVSHQVFGTSHSPLMYPSVYILKKNT
jgi:SAM-dependent methyltransferase